MLLKTFLERLARENKKALKVSGPIFLVAGSGFEPETSGL